MAPRPSSPIDSFGPEILATLLKGAREEIRIPTTYRRGVALRQRLYQLRTAMQKQNHELRSVVARVKVILEWGKRAGLPEVEEVFNSKKVARPRDSEVPAILIVRPHDSEFTKALTDAGVQVNEAEDPLRERSVDNILESYLAPEGEKR